MSELSKQEIIQIIIDTLKPIGVSKISIFGSFLKETGNFKDIDILVSFPQKKRPFIGLKWFAINQELEEKIGCPVDLISDESLQPRFRANIERDLQVIYEEAG